MWANKSGNGEVNGGLCPAGNINKINRNGNELDMGKWTTIYRK